MELVISVVIGVLIVEVYAWLPKISNWLIELAIQRVHSEQQNRCREEWNAGLDALPNTVLKLVHALSFIGAAHRINADFFEIKLNEVDSLIRDLGHKHSSSAARLRAAKERHDQNEISRRENFKCDQASITALREGPHKANLSVEKAVRSLEELNKRLDSGLGRASALLTVCIDSSVERLDHVQSLILEASKKRGLITELLDRRPMPTDAIDRLLADLNSDLRTIKNIFADDKWGDDDAFKEQRRIRDEINNAVRSLSQRQHDRRSGSLA